MLVFPARRYSFVRTLCRLEAVEYDGNKALYSLPWREFVSELFFWLLAGAIMAGSYLVIFEAPWATAVKVMLGCLSFGLLGGILCFLSFEKRLIDVFRGLENPPESFPGRSIPVSWKMFFFMTTILVFMAVAVLLMTYMNINHLLMNRDGLRDDIHARVFVDIFFALSVLLFLGGVIVKRYSRNLRAVLDLQIGVMGDIGKGDYSHRVPVVSNDEFGLIAAETNKMIEGLRERDFCEVSFGRYMAPEISEKILRGEIPSDGEIREVSVLFCDLRGYTPFVEQNTPREVVSFLNDYFTEMEQAVKRFQGIVLQYIGDEIEVVFGAPDDLPDHAEQAVRAALNMRERMAEINRKRSRLGEEPVAHGIGIHSGEVFAGSVGSPERLVYALVGDTVNAASRIQDLNKQFGTDILVSETTMRLAAEQAGNFESLGKTRLRGRREGLEVFRLR